MLESFQHFLQVIVGNVMYLLITIAFVGVLGVGFVLLFRRLRPVFWFLRRRMHRHRHHRQRPQRNPVVKADRADYSAGADVHFVEAYDDDADN
jgi:ABC-type nickel/cobalt efflux system permease component RcnA